MKEFNEDIRVEKLLEGIRESCLNVLGDNLIGVYLHGSLALGCFQWDISDVDYLVVTRDIPDLSTRVQLLRRTLELNESAPEKGLEMSVVSLFDCRNFIYPTPFSFHFSNMHRERAQADPVGYCRGMHGVDPDLAAHFTITRHAGKVLYGLPIESVFAPVPEKDYLASIRDDLENAVEDITENPVYVILNLCRVLAYLREKLVLSKAQGGEWGIRTLSEFEDVIRPAWEAYSQGKKLVCRPGDERLRQFANAMSQMIFR